jgi:hypothetical protein
MMGQHFMAHKTKLVMQVLFNLPMVAKYEGLLQSLFFTFQAPLDDIWNSISLLKLWK